MAKTVVHYAPREEDRHVDKREEGSKRYKRVRV